jgi:hypothetical protein
VLLQVDQELVPGLALAVASLCPEQVENTSANRESADNEPGEDQIRGQIPSMPSASRMPPGDIYRHDDRDCGNCKWNDRGPARGNDQPSPDDADRNVECDLAQRARIRPEASPTNCRPYRGPRDLSSETSQRMSTRDLYELRRPPPPASRPQQRFGRIHEPLARLVASSTVCV